MSSEAAPGGESASHSPSEWASELAAHIAGPHAESAAASFAARAPASYKDQTSPAEAALDLAELAELHPPHQANGGTALGGGVFGGDHRLLVRPSEDPACTFRLRRYGKGAIELTSFLPVLESFGLIVVDAVPHRIAASEPGGPAFHIDDIGLRVDTADGIETLRFVPEIHGPRLVDALEAVARGEAEVDSLNRLVTVAGLDWRQVTLLRCYLRYRLQAGTPLTAVDLTNPLVEFPDVARGLVGYFHGRFDPDLEREPSGASPEEAAERARCVAALDLVPRLEDDRVLRGYLRLIDATVRTNYFQVGGDGSNKPVVVLKLDSGLVPELPNPRPKFEAFVHGPSIEGIHLRAGLIARGGLRWSDRPADFRTEILDLAFAQVKKNAIIVPTGAKGGFVCRLASGFGRPPGVRLVGSMVPVKAEDVKAAYATFVRSLLEITDNVSGGKTIVPAGVVARDEPDPYLVVAADKGTSTFSDLANSISEELGFWLGDAFASGGSRGYDHKKLGITAKGAWVAVRRHFRQLGIDVQRESISVVGVGDMSGDVFGNGMLQSDRIRLVAAFDHRHVFLDPEPDSERSFEERRRLAELPASSWADYRGEVISPGGGVWPRDAKTVPLAPAVRRTLGVEAESLSPPEVISAILAAPVDLLFFGGIGTFIKAPAESDADVGDHANDSVRITSDRVRTRVIAEGANLGVTQQARIRYSRRGGRINTDFVDNAAGVATSDREVNLKILLALAIEERRLDPAQRDSYLHESTGEVTTEVLRQVDHNVAALERAVVHSAREPDAFAALIDALEGAGAFNRQVESLPEPEELRIRREAGAGLIRPELAVLLAYARSNLVAEIEKSIGPVLSKGHPYLEAVVPYFPVAIRRDFEDLIPRHRLYPQLAATDVAGDLVDQLGIVWAHETAAEMGRRLDEVAAAFWAAREVIGAGSLWSELEALAASLTAEAEAALQAEISEAVIRLARSYLARPGVIDIGALITADSVVADQIGASRSDDAVKASVEQLVDLGIERDIAARYVLASGRADVADARPVMDATGRNALEALECLDGVDRAAGTEGIASAVSAALSIVPPPRRLTVWLGRSVLDDLADWRRNAATRVLRLGTSPTDALAAWEVANADALRSAAQMLGSSARAGEALLDSAVLAIRRLQRAV
ncbi:MAG TPA: NAD-glutamate dehydrogenase domain-containing protein [Acidimicrobiales bacterium]